MYRQILACTPATIVDQRAVVIVHISEGMPQICNQKAAFRHRRAAFGAPVDWPAAYQDAHRGRRYTGGTRQDGTKPRPAR